MLKKTKAAVLVLALTLSMCVVFANESAYAAQDVNGVQMGTYRAASGEYFTLNADYSFTAYGNIGQTGNINFGGMWETYDGSFIRLFPSEHPGEFGFDATPSGGYSTLASFFGYPSGELVFTLGGAAAPAANPITILFDGKPLHTDVPPQIMNGSTMVPIRAVTEAFGCEVKWEPTHQTIEIVYGVVRNGDWVKIDMTIGSRDVSILGVDDDFEFVSKEPYTISSPPVIVESRTLVPLRFIAEAFDLKVGWDDGSRTVTISSP